MDELYIYTAIYIQYRCVQIWRRVERIHVCVRTCTSKFVHERECTQRVVSQQNTFNKAY